MSSQSDTPSAPQRLGEQKYPLFVTWNTLSKSGRKSLRGCIGTFEPQVLPRGLKHYAFESYVHLPCIATAAFKPFPIDPS
jgi:AMMECR1 domain-containing protein